MTANLQQRPRKRPTRLDRGSMTRSNAAHPPALHFDQRDKRREASWSAVALHRSLGTYAYCLQRKLTHPSAGSLSARSTWLHLSVGNHRFRPQRQRTGALHDAGAFAVPLKITRADRRSTTRSNMAHPPALPLTIAFNNPHRLGPRWQPAAPKRSEGGSAATTPLSPAPYVPNSTSTPHPHHPSFCCQAELRLRH